MKIVFLCGSLEAGRDGVGDYCRKLSMALQASGQETLLIAVNDFHIKDLQKEEGILRIPSRLGTTEKRNLTRKYIHNFHPDFISLQMVSYAYNAKGILIGYPDFFQKITAGYKVQLTFHELWLGVHNGASVKEKMVGGLQRYFLKRLIKKVEPFCIHSTTKLYEFLLKQEGIDSTCLPVFANIKRNTAPDFQGVYRSLSSTVPSFTEEKRADWLVVLFFGKIDPSWDFSEAMDVLKKVRDKMDRKVLVVSAGRAGKEATWNKMMNAYSPFFSFYKFGEMDEQRISTLMSFSDIGISSYPHILTEKSGSIAAMREHQLPVLISNFTINVHEFHHEDSMDPLIIHSREFEHKFSFKRSERKGADSSLQEVCAMFLNTFAS